MPVQEIWVNSGGGWDDNDGGYSFSGTVNLPRRMPFAVAQVMLTRSAYFDYPGWSQVYLTGYSANGNPVPVNGDVVLGINNADSFTFQADILQGAITASMVVHCFY